MSGKKTAKAPATPQTNTTDAATVKPAATVDLPTAAAKPIQECALALTVSRATRVLTHEHGRPAKDRTPTSLYPFNAEDEALLLQLAIEVGVIERAAVLQAIAPILAPDVLEQVKNAVEYERGPLARALRLSMKWSDEQGWRESGVAPELATSMRNCLTEIAIAK